MCTRNRGEVTTPWLGSLNIDRFSYCDRFNNGRMKTRTDCGSLPAWVVSLRRGGSESLTGGTHLTWRRLISTLKLSTTEWLVICVWEVITLKLRVIWLAVLVDWLRFLGQSQSTTLNIGIIYFCHLATLHGSPDVWMCHRRSLETLLAQNTIHLQTTWRRRWWWWLC